jgi:hypothetical protein
MRISTVANATPDSSPPVPGDERERYVWQDLALRLIHPIRFSIIEALYRCERAMAVADLAAVVGERGELVRYHCEVLVGEGVLEAAEVRARGDGGNGDEALLYFPLPAQGPLPSPSAVSA